MIGFILPNCEVEGEFWDYSLSVDDVEKFTGVDFFCGLRDRDEEELESVLDVE